MINKLIATPSNKWFGYIIGILAIALGLLIGLLVGKVDNLIYVFAVVTGLAVVVLTISRTEIGLLVFIIVTYLRISDILVHNYGAPSIARMLIAILILSIAMKWASTNSLPKGWITPAILVVAYGVVIFGSLIYATDFDDALTAFSDFWKDGLIAILVVALVQKKETFTRSIWALILGGLILGGISVYQFQTGTFSNDYWGLAESPLQNIVGTTEGNRVAGPIGDPNFYAQIMVVLIPIGINRLIFSKSILLKIFAGLSVLVSTLSVFYTYSRGGLFALGIALIAFFIYHRIRLGTLLFLIGISIFVLTLMPSNFIARISTVTDVISGQQDPRSEISFRGRTSEMLSAINMFADHPILGVGAENYPANYQKYARQLGLDTRAEERQPHNLYLQIAAEMGILGILVFGAILYYMFFSINQARKGMQSIANFEQKDLIGAFAAGLIGYLAAAIFIHGAYPRYLWLLAGLAMSLPQVVKSEIESQKRNVEK